MTGYGKYFAISFLFTCSAFGQFETSEVLGTVNDASGAAMPDVSLTLTNQNTRLEMKTVSDAAGNYDFLDVKVGRYRLAARRAGFALFTMVDILVDVEARQRIDIRMEVGGVDQRIDVNGAAETLETDSSEHDQVINTQQVVELPLNGRNYSDLALLSTNVHRSPLSVLFAANGTPREGAFNVNGMRSTYNNFLLDGLDNNAYSPSNQGYSSQVVQPSPDAISEFKVITTNFAAEYGRVGGGVINTALRSGTNEFHGTAYEFLRNTDLNATGFTFSPAVFQKPTLQRNQYGLTIGGPFIKNKLFFFADYEGFRQLQRYLNFDSIPNLKDRGGILPVTVVDPLTRVVYPAGSPIPIAQLNPFAAQVLGALPAPNGPGRSNDYEALLLVRDYSDKYDAKLDYQINDKMSSFLRFSQRKDLQYYEPDIPGPSGGNGNGYIHAIQQQAAAGYTWTLSPTSLLDARFGFDHILAGKVPPYLGGPSMDQLYGIPGLPTSPDLTGGLNSQAVSGFSQLGRQTSNPQFQNPTSFNPKLNYSWIKGRHALKLGYEFTGIRTEVLDINPLYGADTYAGQFSKPACAELGKRSGCTITSDAASYDLADFIFGLPSTIQLGNDLVTNLRQHIHALYIQDDYRVNSKLTLNLGLRWEFATPIWERDNNWSNFDPATGTLIRAANGSLYDRALVHPDYKDFGPRLGLAYSFTPKTVLRAGYGISYSFFNRVGSAQEGINAPQALFGLLTQSIPAGGAVPSTFLTTQNSFTTGLNNPANFNPITQNIDYIPANTRWPYIQSWFFSLQRKLTEDTVLEVAYNGNHSLRLPILGDYNQANPNLPGQTLGVQARRPIQSFGAITWLDPAGDNDYNGLSARLEHRFGGGLYFLNSFTWSKALGDSEQALEYYPGYYEANPQNIRNLADERGPSSFDVEFMNVTSVVYQLPFGKGRKYGSAMNPVLGAVAGGWELNSINTANTGTPIDVSYSPSAANDVTGLTNDYRGEAILRPNVTGTAATNQSKSAMVNNYFAGYTFATPPASDPFGDAGRNAFRAPGLEQWDLAADKSFRIRERTSLQFRSEFFNVLNHTNFGLPTAITTNAAFGTIRTTYPARQIQFALKLLF
ncbi:MAG TPA: TonB-dependent receptor [Bryobacteraceae bacterium]|nr:TonB-dependent receptor [Bryobacteraceae bacterium]